MDPATVFHRRIAQYDPIFPVHFRKFISQNRKITMDMVLQDMARNPSKKDEWTFENLCTTISVDTLLAHGFYPKDNVCRNGIMGCMNITFDTILRTYQTQTLSWDWEYITMHKSIRIEDILAHPELPWDIRQIPNNPHFRFHHYVLFAKHYPHLMDNPLTLFKSLSKHATFEQIMQMPEQPWTLECLQSPHIQKEHIPELLVYFKNKYPDLSNHLHLTWICSQNSNLTFEDLQTLFGEAAFLFAYSCVTFTLDDFLNVPLSKWDPGVITCLGNQLPMEFIVSHPEYNWNWISMLSFSKHLRYEGYEKVPPELIACLEDVWKKVPTAPWAAPAPDTRHRVMGSYFKNPYLPVHQQRHLMDELLAYYRANPPQNRDPSPFKNYFMYCWLLESPLFLEPTPEEIREHLAKRRIIRILVEVLSNPVYLQCRKRLAREFHSFQLPRKKLRTT